LISSILNIRFRISDHEERPYSGIEEQMEEGLQEPAGAGA
jgi:hypothetical protein